MHKFTFTLILIISMLFSFVYPADEDTKYNPWTYKLDYIKSESWFNGLGDARYFKLDASNSPITSGFTVQGVIVNDGLTMGINELITLGAETLTHNATDFILSDTIRSDTDSTDDLGSSSVFFANTYSDKVQFNATSSIDGLGSSNRLDMTGDIFLSNASSTIIFNEADDVTLSGINKLLSVDGGLFVQGDVNGLIPVDVALGNRAAPYTGTALRRGINVGTSTEPIANRSADIVAFGGFNIIGGSLYTGGTVNGLNFANVALAVAFAGLGDGGSSSLSFVGLDVLGASGIGATLTANNVTGGVIRASDGSGGTTNIAGDVVDLIVGQSSADSVTGTHTALLVWKPILGSDQFQVRLPGTGAGHGIFMGSTSTGTRIYQPSNGVINISELSGGTDLVEIDTTDIDLNRNVLIGDETAAANVTLTWQTSTTSGLMNWVRAADRFRFDDDVQIATGESLVIRDAAIGFRSDDDTFLDVFADGAIRINIGGNFDYTLPLTDGGTAGDIMKTDASGNTAFATPTVNLPISFSMYDAEPARGSETSMDGAFLILATAQPLDSVPTNLVVTKGIGKLVIIVNAGSDLAGDITVTGTSVDRDTGATTGADTDTITVDAVTTDGSDTDTNGNARHSFTGAYITSKWFTGTVTLSTANLTLTDVDVYHVSFEQFDDQTDLTLETFDANILTTNVAGEFDAYLYSLVVAGDKCTIAREASLNVGADGETAIANKYWRLRRGNINKSLDGTSDGVWADIHYSNSPAYVEDVTVKVWAMKSQILTLS